MIRARIGISCIWRNAFKRSLFDISALRDGTLGPECSLESVAKRSERRKTVHGPQGCCVGESTKESAPLGARSLMIGLLLNTASASN